MEHSLLNNEGVNGALRIDARKSERSFAFKPSYAKAEFFDRFNAFVENIDTDSTVRGVLELAHSFCKKQIGVVNYNTGEFQFYPVLEDGLQLIKQIKKGCVDESNLIHLNESVDFLRYEKGRTKGMLINHIDNKSTRFLVINDVDIETDSVHISEYIYVMLILKVAVKERGVFHNNIVFERNSFYNALIEGEAGLVYDISSRANRLGVLLEKRCFAIALSIKDTDSKVYDDQEKEDSLNRFLPVFELVKEKYNILSGVTKNNYVFFIVPAKDVSGKEQKDYSVTMAEIIKDAFKERFPETELTLGIGDTVEEIVNISESYEKALRALKYTRSIWGNGTTLHYRDMGIFQILNEPAVRKRLKPFLMDYLGPLLIMDKSESVPLLETVYAYVLTGFSYRKCSRKLFLHHNTVRYRIEKVEQICNIDLKNASDLVSLLVCLEITKFCDEYNFVYPSMKSLFDDE